MPRRRRDASLEERVEQLDDRVDALVHRLARLAPTSSSMMDDALETPQREPGAQPQAVKDADYTGGNDSVLSDL